MKSTKQTAPQKTTIFSLKLLDFLSILKVVADYETTAYCLFGLPIWKIRILSDTHALLYQKKYYLLGVPLWAETYREYEDSDENQL